MTKVYLSTGSNLGDRLENLAQAARLLDSKRGIKVLRLSQVYETEPWGYLDQPAFLNQVVEIATTIPPLRLLRTMKKIEKEGGRKPGFRYGPRVIDVDIIFYGAEVFAEQGLNIPHPQVAQRAFVLVPLAELVGEFVHPALGQSVQTMADQIDTSGVRLYVERGEQ